MHNKKILSIKEKNIDYVIYCDTDSVAGESIVRSNLYGNISLENLFIKLTSEKGNECVTDIAGRNFIFPSKLKLPFYDDTTDQIKNGSVDYIEKHIVEKELFEIITEQGRSIIVTDDHSLIVDRNGNLTEIKANDLKENDVLICII